VVGVDAWRRGWVGVWLEAGRTAVVRAEASLAALLAADVTAGIDMPLGLAESGWREADLAARRLLGPRRSSVFAIPPRSVWAQQSYLAANQRCRELTGQGFSAQAWGLRARLLEASAYREACAHPLYEVHPELAFRAMAGAPLPFSKHTPEGRELRRELLAGTGIGVPPPVTPVPVTDVLDAAAVAWSAWRIATGSAVTIPDRPQHDEHGREIAIRYLAVRVRLRSGGAILRRPWRIPRPRAASRRRGRACTTRRWS
jgi:predicted RNase H-like nuclease